MAMVVADLADATKNALGFGAFSTSSQNTGLAKSIVDELAASVVNFAPGTINGAAPSSGGPLIGGVGLGGLVVGITPATLAARFALNMGFGSVSAELLQMATAISTHVLASTITLPLVTGACSNTPVSPGALVGEASNGIIVGLNGAALSVLMAVAYGGIVSPQLLAFATAITTYLTANLQVDFSTGTIVGVCPAGGGPITAGAGTGGVIS